MAAQGGDVDDYWLYPTRSNITPTLAQANSVGDISNPGSNVANYLQGADWNGQNGNFTTVGSAGPLSESFFGTSDQGGNHAEWNESLFQTVFRGIRGGAIGALPSAMESSNRGSNSPGIVGIGFRVAAIPSVPEPSTLALAALGALGLLNAARHRKR